MFKRILVPIDGSGDSRRALQQAVELAKLNDSEIILLHVLFTPEALGYMLSGGVTVVQDQLNVNGEVVLETTTKETDMSEVKVTKKLLPGHPAAIILEEIGAERIDLVVMGSRGFGPLAGSLLGSVSQRVLQKAECPVMIVK
ncbi:MAG: universal stress protein [Desulfitobacteriaceae bacterium]